MQDALVTIRTFGDPQNKSWQKPSRNAETKVFREDEIPISRARLRKKNTSFFYGNMCILLDPLSIELLNLIHIFFTLRFMVFFKFCRNNIHFHATGISIYIYIYCVVSHIPIQTHPRLVDSHQTPTKRSSNQT